MERAFRKRCEGKEPGGSAPESARREVAPLAWMEPPIGLEPMT